MKEQLTFTLSDAMGTRMEKNYLIGTLYIRKDQVEGTPQKLNVTVETV